MNLSKNTKYVKAKGTQHSGDHGNSDMERKPPTGTRQFGGIEASLAQAEIVEAVKTKYFAKFVKQNCIGTYYFHFGEISSTGLANRVKIVILLCLHRC